MISIVYGVPGSGKTYYSVYRLSKILKNNDNFVLISNIENLKIDHLKLDDLINNYGGLDNFFNVDCEFWKQDLEKKKLLFIDEAQRYFNKRFFSSTVFFFFQYHRHLNIDIYLITQSYKTLPTELVVLCELLVQAVPPSFRIFGNSFRYLVKDLETHETVDKFDIPFDRSIASLYTSALVVDKNRKMTYTQKYVLISVVLVVVALFVLLIFFPKLLLNKSSDKSKNNSSSISSSKSNLSKSNLPSNDLSSNVVLPDDDDDDDGFSFPNNISSAGYKLKRISYGQFLNQYRNGITYDLSVDYIIVYDENNRVKDVYIYKDVPLSPEKRDDINISSDISSDISIDF